MVILFEEDESFELRPGTTRGIVVDSLEGVQGLEKEVWSFFFAIGGG